jgi:Acetyl-CoA carboxylase, central region.
MAEKAAPIIHTYQRTGCMAAFESFTQFENYFDEILDLLEDFASPAQVPTKIMEAVESGSESRNSTSINVSLSVDTREEPAVQLQVRV